MLGAELLEELRRDLLQDVSEPQHWGDDYLMRLLNDAENTFAGHTHCLIQDRIEVVTVARTAVYPMPDLLHVKAVHDDAGFPLQQVTANQLYGAQSEGRPRGYMGRQGRDLSLLLYPTPDAEYTVYVTAATLPEVSFDDATQPSIPPQWHRSLTYYAAMVALQSYDSQTVDPETARTYREIWLRDLRDAKAEAFRMAMGQNPNALHSMHRGTM